MKKDKTGVLMVIANIGFPVMVVALILYFFLGQKEPHITYEAIFGTLLGVPTVLP